MILTNENYYSTEANMEYMSVSQYKQFMSCEAAAMAELRGDWFQPKKTALMVGSYVDSWFEGTLSQFKSENPEIFKRDGSLKSDYVQAEELIAFVKEDKRFMEYVSGIKQKIYTAELFGTPWKIKIDSLHATKIVDLKVVRSMERIMGKSFVEHWGYDLQMAVYSEVVKRVTGQELSTFLAVVTKQTPPDKDVIHIPQWRRKEKLDEVERNMPRILKVKSGQIEPEKCGVCEYCRYTKEILEPIEFDLVGLSTAERKAIFGVL